MQNNNEREEGQMSEGDRDESLLEERAEGELQTPTKQGGGRGFAGMSPQKRKEIASKGGRSQGKDNNSGNFANNREKAVAAGRLGGQNSRGGGRQANQDSGPDTVDLSELSDAE